ncbi:glycerophosphodiester phosphodiesterase [Pseudolactococcus insecticola]|uniref:Glycerophosphodiester phosphodiesterase n=1 Tax=Pseudolactococcus insecticola TaxID=2709158 RepID=A0A6A0B800_9LACT|nr:glycerophosphodiester phosphodiesterase [Lactococcus insecticola]GFH40474.1 glycerophosphodiester phosphodiesterase [Lactococcus insecticola]
MFTGIKKWYRRTWEARKSRRAKLQAKISPRLQKMFATPTETLIFAHRGSKSNRPENTLASFAEAVRVGTDGIELDVHLTHDQKLVVIHDETLERTTNGSGLVRELTFEKIRSYSAGAWFSDRYKREKIPLLSEVLELLCELDFKGVLNIEIKTDKYPYPNIEQITSELMTSQNWPFSHIYCSFNIQSLQTLSQLEPEVELCLLMSTSDKKIQQGLAADFITHLHPRLDWAQKNAKKLPQIPKPLRPWTPNNDADIHFAFDHHLAGFMTDYPELAVRIKQMYNQK